MQNYYNPYQYNYGNYGGNQSNMNYQPNNYQQPTYQPNNYQSNMNYQNQSQLFGQSSQQPPQYQPVAHKLMYVSGLEGARAFIVEPNKTVYLMDSESQTMFIKSADKDGRFYLKAFELNEVGLDTIGRSKDDKMVEDYVTRNELNEFKNNFFNELNNLSNELKKVQKPEKYELIRGDTNE